MNLRATHLGVWDTTAQVVLLSIKAQIDCYVPIQFATFRIFSGVSNRDCFKSNSSTFIQMQETSLILANLGPTSLIIIDELGWAMWEAPPVFCLHLPVLQIFIPVSPTTTSDQDCLWLCGVHPPPGPELFPTLQHSLWAGPWPIHRYLISNLTISFHFSCAGIAETTSGLSARPSWTSAWVTPPKSAPCLCIWSMWRPRWLPSRAAGWRWWWGPAGRTVAGSTTSWYCGFQFFYI